MKTRKNIAHVQSRQAGWVFFFFVLVNKVFPYSLTILLHIWSKVTGYFCSCPSSRNKCNRAFLVQSWDQPSIPSSLLTTFAQIIERTAYKDKTCATIKPVQLLHRPKIILLKGLLLLAILSACIQLYGLTQSESLGTQNRQSRAHYLLWNLHRSLTHPHRGSKSLSTRNCTSRKDLMVFSYCFLTSVHPSQLQLSIARKLANTLKSLLFGEI